MWLIIIPFQVAAIASIQITNSKTFLCTERKEMAQSCPTLCYPMDCSLPGSSVHGIFQARVLEWVAISFSWRSFQSRDWTCVSCIGRRILYHRAIWEAHLIVYRVQTRSMGPRKTWNPKGGVSCSMSSYHYWMKESSEEQGRAMPEACHSSWHKVDNKHSIK